MPWIAACLCLLTAGCDHNVYQLEVTPSASGINRKLTCWRTNALNQIVAMPEAELNRLAALYGQTIEPPFDRRHVFQADFTGELPDDLGGAGYYLKHESPFGTECAYQERFRGEVDIVGVLERREAAADELTGYVIGWFEQELANEPGFPRLREFLDTEFRRDIKNVGLLTWLAAYKDEEVPMRVAQYLVERGYGDQDEVLALLANGSSSETTTSQLISRFVATKLGIAEEAPLPESLGFLGSSDALEQSLVRYLQTTDEFIRRRAEWERSQPTNPTASEPDAKAVFAETFSRALLSGGALQAADELTLTLNSGIKPYATNGTWNESEGQVQWTEKLHGPEGPPAFCYALWSVPNLGAQRHRFGRVLLEGQDLALYIRWYNGLDPAHRKAWDDFISALPRGSEMAPSIAEFRFADEPLDESSDPPAAFSSAEVRGYLLKQLNWER